MARPRERIRGLPLPPIAFGGPGPVGGGFGGGAGGGPLDLTPEPFGLPPELIGQLEGLDAAVTGQLEAERERGIPKGIVASELTDAQALHFAGRARSIRDSVPGIDGPTAAQFAFSGISLDDAIRLARARFAQGQPKSWWQKIPGIEPLGKALHATFIAGPEWLWRRSVVDGFQELAELGGIEPRIAQRLSPMQASFALTSSSPVGPLVGPLGAALAQMMGLKLPAPESLRRGLIKLGMRDAEGNLRHPDDWDDRIKIMAGMGDFLMRMTMDPTLVLGKARRGLLITGKGVRYVRPGAGGAQRAVRLRELADLDPERAFRVARRMMEGGRTQTFTNFVFGNAGAQDVVRAMVTGHTGMRRFVDDVVDLRDSPKLGAEILGRYGAVRHGWGMRKEQAAFIERAVQRATTREEAFRNAEESVISLLTGRFTPLVKSELDEVIARWNATTAMRHDAVRRRDELRKAADETDIIRTGGPRVDGFGAVHHAAGPDASPERSLAAIELGASRERAFASQVRDPFDPFVPGREDLLGMGETLGRHVDEVEEEIKGVADELSPFLDVWKADPIERKAILGDMLEIRSQLGVNLPLAEYPFESVFDVRAPSWLGGRPLRHMPPFRYAQMQAHRSVGVHDPYWHDQYQRLARRAGMSEDEITTWIDRVMKNGTTPQAMAGITSQFVRASYRKVGLPETEIDELFEAAGRNSQQVFARVGGRSFTDPLYATQEINFMQLADPKLMRAFRRLTSSPGFASMTARQVHESATRILDTGNTIMKRLWVAFPKSGMRALLENQARALAMGVQSFYTNPLVPLVVLPTAVFAPGLARKAAVRLSPKAVRDVAVRAGDVGMSQILYQSGMLSAQAYKRRQVLAWKDMRSPLARHNYRKAQASYTNDFMNEEFVRRMMLDGPDEARAWIKSSAADAAAYRALVPRLRKAEGRKNFEALMDRHTDTVSKHMDEVGLSDPRIQAIVSERALQAADLKGLEAPEIVGASFFHGDPNFLKTILDAFVGRHMGGVDFIGRDYTTRAELYSEVWRRVGHARAAGQAVDDKAVKAFLAGGIVKGKGVEHAIYEGARRDVHGKVKSLFFDLAEQSRFADMFRFVFPFGHVYQEIAQTWARILVERPWVPHLASVLFQNAGEVPGVTFTDPVTGEKQFRIPLSGRLLQFAGLRAPNPITGVPDDVAYSLGGRLSGFNMISTGLPIPGPIAQWALRDFLKNKPGFDDVWQVLFPYGDRDLIDSVQPGFVRNFRAWYSGYLKGPGSNHELGALVSDLVVEEAFGILQRFGREPNAKDLLALDRIDTEAITVKARRIFAIRAAASFGFPAAIRERSPLKDDIEFFHYLNEIDPSFANQVFLAKGGSPAYKALVAGETDLWPDVPWQPPTKKARKLLLSSEGFRDFVDAFGNPGWDVWYESWVGEFDSDLIRDQLLSGDRRRRTIPERLAAIETMVAWDYYFQAMDSLDKRMSALGIANIDQEEAIVFKQAKARFTGRLMQAFPKWAKDFEHTGGGSKTEQIASLAIMSNIPELQRLDAVQGLKEYFAVRAQAGDSMRANKIGSLTSQKSIPLKIAWREAVRDIVRRHPHFARIWGRYLERDNPADSLIDRMGEKGVLRHGIIKRSGLTEREGVRRTIEKGLAY